ncbi:hypothetical protein LZ31DRAFT_350266 [Colletotrichum somersetense]|nr:hypothetical protein LZ31DRAFT_350266 [Colletotrichum somersetense]
MAQNWYVDLERKCDRLGHQRPWQSPRGSSYTKQHEIKVLLSTRPALPKTDQKRRYPLKSADGTHSEPGISSRNMTCIHGASQHHHSESNFRGSLPASQAIACQPPFLAQTATEGEGPRRSDWVQAGLQCQGKASNQTRLEASSARGVTTCPASLDARSVA